MLGGWGELLILITQLLDCGGRVRSRKFVAISISFYFNLECGTQATGGNHTDWESVPDFDNLGFPIAEVSSSGEMLITKVQ